MSNSCVCQDFFQRQHELPPHVRAVIDRYTGLIEENEGDAYLLCRDFLHAMEAIGFSFEYGLDGVPFDLRPFPTANPKVSGGHGH